MSQPPKKNAFVIHAFKQQPPKDTDMPVRSWKKLHEAITQIFNEDAGALSFEELYRTGYNMVLHKHGDTLYQNVEGLFRERSTALCEKVERTPDETFLASLRKVWLDYKRSLQMVRDILMYMDRTYVKMNKKRPVYEMGLAIFCQHCARTARVRERILNMLLQLVQAERNGDMVDRSLIRAIALMLKDMGEEVFAEDLEQPFKEASQQYYMVESGQLMAACSTPEYLRKVEARLSEEAERVTACLLMDYSAGQGGVRQVVEGELIGRHMQALVDKEGSGLVPLLEDDRVEDLRRLSDLLSRVAGGHELLESRLAEYVATQGKEVVLSNENQADPLLFVHRLLALKDKFDGIIAQAFRGDKSTINKVHKAFEAFLNLNPRAPEYISLAMDSYLRGSKGKFAAAAHASEEQAETRLEKALQMFRFVQEKDLFERYYKQHLARRLLGDRSQSDDMERRVIQMLKTECGYQFTAKLEGMFKDINTSRDLQAAFRLHVDKSEAAGAVDLSVKVLTTGYWPTQQSAQCQLPPVLDRACALFKRFYLAQHNGRQLTWQSNMGNADIKARYDKSYLINIPSMHMVVLLLFNEVSTLGYAEIAEATSIPAADLKRVLQSLACGHYKLLVKEPKGKEVADSDKFSFNSKFTNKMIKFKVASIAAAKETNEEVLASRNKMNEDRNPQIDAAIVRVMKSRRVMDHNNLIAEVTKQLQSRFSPNPVVLKKRIEGLIDRDFLQRQRGNIKTYEYLA